MTSALIIPMIFFVVVMSIILYTSNRTNSKKDNEGSQARPTAQERNSQIAGSVASAAASQIASQDRSQILMAKVRCSGCGAAIEPGMKFCSHCGMQIPDDTFRAEIRVDDSADMMRVRYEEQESKIRQKKMKSELIKNRIAWGLIIFIALLGITCLVLCFADKETGFLWILYAGLLLALAIYLAIKQAMKK